VLTERGALLLPPLVREEIKDNPSDLQNDSAGSFFVTQGDIDNDGDADVIVTHVGSNFERTALPSLYVNRLNEPTVRKFTEEYQQRVDLASFSSNTVHSTPAVDFSGNPLYGGNVADETWAIELADIDADGDLDMICVVGANVPRILRNKGVDTNGDGVIDASDGSGLGTFEDVTDSAIPWAFPQNDGNDIAIVDLDGDGFLDFAIDSFQGGVSLWRNQSAPDSFAHVTGIWPRVGSIRKDNSVIELGGVRLANVNTVRFRYRGGQIFDISGSSLNPIDDRRVQVQLQSGMPVGLAQIQVKIGNRWSRQYIGYFILE
jgi:hypothetical protein